MAHPWPTSVQVEQDLLLSRAICAIANDPYLNEELVFRGGTALHKLHVEQALHYSEDLSVRQRCRTLTSFTGWILAGGRVKRRSARSKQPS